MSETILAWHFVGDTLRNGRPIPLDGDWLVHDGPIKPCASGLHASERIGRGEAGMTDIVKRLRDKWMHSEEDCYKAADEIERLRAENEHLRTALQMLIKAHDNEWHPMKITGCEWFNARAALTNTEETHG